MPQPNSRSLLTVDLQTPTRRALLLLPVIAVLLVSWFVVRWYIADTVAEYAPGADAGGREMASLAVRWAPGDPFARWKLADVAGEEFSPSRLAEAVRENELAVSLSPNDYRYWMALGRALERAGDSDGGEHALRRAVELAPSYSYPRWYLGNLLVREGKDAEAFDQLARAGEADPKLRPQVLSLVWEVLDGNVDAITKAVCPSASARAYFASYLIRQRQKIDEGLKVWAGLTPEEKKAEGETGQEIEVALVNAKRFRDSLSVLRDLAPDKANLPKVGEFSNGGFEADAREPDPKGFGWVIGSSADAQISVVPGGHTGASSLRIAFRASGKLEALPVSQRVVVDPATDYRFECYVRTDNLRSGGTPVVEILDANDGSLLARSRPLPVGTNDWQPITLEFSTRPKSEAITVQLNRASCGDSPVCPILGTVWYDDFDLQRIGRAGN